MDKMTNVNNVASNTRRWTIIMVYTIFNISGINPQTIHMVNNNVKIRHKIFIRNLVIHLVSEQIKRCSQIFSGVPKTLHLQLHQFQRQMEWNSNNDIDTSPPQAGKKTCVRCYASKTSCLLKYIFKYCEPWA